MPMPVTSPSLTTFVSLLLRLYDPQQGSIMLNGIDLRHYGLSDLRGSYGVVPQDPYIFQGSVLDNVKVGRPEANDTEVHEAMRVAYVDEFVAQMAHGGHTEVGEGG